MKLFKNKKVVLASAIVLGVAAVTSSALAAYIITGGTVGFNDDVETTDINVTNKVVNLTVGEQTGELYFMPEEVVSTGRLTTQAGDVGNLMVSFKLTMEAASKDLIPDLVVTVTEKDGGTAVSGKYVKLPETTGVINVSGDSFEGDSGSFTYTLNLVWDWGEIFGSMDPCAFFNDDTTGQEFDDTYVGKTMEDFKGVINNTAFNVDIAEAPGAGA